MRALLISGIYPPDIGGPATYIPKLGRYLEERRWSARVVSLQNGKRLRKSRHNGKFIGRNLFLPIRFLTTVYTIFVEGKKSDSLFANGLHQEVAIASLFLKKRMVAKIVGDPVWERYRNKSDEDLTINDFEELLKYHLLLKIQRKFLVWSLGKFDVIVCPSRDLCELVRKWGVKSPTIYVPNGIQIQQPISQSQFNYDIAVVSRLVKWKNIDLLLESCRELQFKIIIVGDGPERKSLEELAIESKCDIFFAGQVDSEEVSRILQKSKIYVSLSSYEGMSFSLLQAMSLRKIVVVSDIPANTELIRHQIEGIVINKDSILNLGKILKDILLNLGQYNNMAEAAASRIKEDFSIEINLVTMESLLVG